MRASEDDTDQHPDGVADAPAPGIGLGRRMISFVASVTLVAGLFGNWQGGTSQYRVLAVLFLIAFLIAMAAIVTTLTVRSRRMLDRVDVGVLISAVLMYALENVSVVMPGYLRGNDETYLGEDALRALLAHHNPYALHYSSAVANFGGTPLLTGGEVTKYDYPPLLLETGWVMHHVWAPLGEPYVLSSVALLITLVIAFFALPRSLSPLALPLILGYGMLGVYAGLGYPIVFAMPILCIAVWRWTSIGAGGRLGRYGVLQAVAMGFGASSHQLAWFLAAFFAVSLWTVRSGEIGRRRALGVVARYAGIAIAAFLVLNSPFIVASAHIWAASLSGVLTQQAVPFGVGTITLTVAVLGHSGALQFGGYATAALIVALLAFTGFGIRRVGLAVPVFVGVMFLFSTRSTVDYLIDFSALWLVWAATADQGAIDRALPVRLPAGLLDRPVRQVAAVVIALVPALALTAVMVATPAPLNIRMRYGSLSGSTLDELVVEVSNVSTNPVRPFFYVGPRSRIIAKWFIAQGPRLLQPGQSTIMVLRPADGASPPQPNNTLYALSAYPSAISSAPVILPPAAVEHQSIPANPQAAINQQCAIEVLSGAMRCSAT